LRVNPAEVGADFYAATGQKWLCGPPATGVLFVRREHVPLLRPAFVSHQAFSRLGRWGEAREQTAEARRFEASTPSPALLAGLSTAIGIARELGRDVIEQRCAALSSYAVSRLMAVAGVRLVSPREGPSMSGLVCFRIGDLEPDQVTASLWERGRVVAGGRQDRSGHPVEYEESTRLSTAWFNTEADIDQAVAQVERLIREGPVAIEHSEWLRSAADS
jgi:L-cysteine/cystine lyase